ncbi:MAG: CPBP family intramembrane metalloprotease, partial [Amoebophilaceae bacterium]|nr:CPBP family intramembrane metalloprotease [Amoebophilaceae bacterium]
ARYITTLPPGVMSPDLDAIAHTDSLAYFLWRGILLFAIFPGIGEELLFRGILQPIILGYTNRPYLAILITSLLFALIHASFYHAIVVFGFSLLSGYIYHSTGNISLVMF